MPEVPGQTPIRAPSGLYNVQIPVHAPDDTQTQANPHEGAIGQMDGQSVTVVAPEQGSVAPGQPEGTDPEIESLWDRLASDLPQLPAHGQGSGAAIVVDAPDPSSVPGADAKKPAETPDELRARYTKQQRAYDQETARMDARHQRLQGLQQRHDQGNPAPLRAVSVARLPPAGDIRRLREAQDDLKLGSLLLRRRDADYKAILDDLDHYQGFLAKIPVGHGSAQALQDLMKGLDALEQKVQAHGADRPGMQRILDGIGGERALLRQLQSLPGPSALAGRQQGLAQAMTVGQALELGASLIEAQDDSDRVAPLKPLGSGAMNTVYSTSLLDGDNQARTGVVKFEPMSLPARSTEAPAYLALNVSVDAQGREQPQLAQRNVASYRLDQALGFDVVPHTAFAVVDGSFASVMEHVQGFNQGHKSQRPVMADAAPLVAHIRLAEQARKEIDRLSRNSPLARSPFPLDEALALRAPVLKSITDAAAMAKITPQDLMRDIESGAHKPLLAWDLDNHKLEVIVRDGAFVAREVAAPERETTVTLQHLQDQATHEANEGLYRSASDAFRQLTVNANPPRDFRQFVGLLASNLANGHFVDAQGVAHGFVVRNEQLEVVRLSDSTTRMGFDAIDMALYVDDTVVQKQLVSASEAQLSQGLSAADHGRVQKLTGASVEGGRIESINHPFVLHDHPGGRQSISIELDDVQWVDYADPALARELVKLQLSDFLAGQLDRHWGNYFIERGADGTRVHAIDNDLSWGASTTPDPVSGLTIDTPAKRIGETWATVNLPRYVDSDMKAAIDALQGPRLADLKRELSGLLTPQQVANFEARLQHLQAHLRDPQRVTVIAPDGWKDIADPDSKLREMLTDKTSSYLGRDHASMQSKLQDARTDNSIVVHGRPPISDNNNVN